MTREEIRALIEECKALYSTYRSMYEDEEVSKEWYRILKYYDIKDIYASLKKHKEGNYQRSPITLGDLTRDLQTITEKENRSLENIKIWCKNCGKTVLYKDAQKHEDRCRSTDYIIIQCKKWLNKAISTDYLWSLSDEEFERRYNSLLRYILEHTTNKQEKEIISYIFNSPSQSETMEFFKTQNAEC
jgi:hypothetical protein